jgi:hypothetical protein
MPFGLTNTPAAFQKFMDCIFASLKCKYPQYLFWFMDNIIIATPNDKKLHKEIVREVLKVLRKESLHLKAKKCRFEQMEMEFLGYLITKGTIKINPTKWHGLEEWPRILKNIKEVHSMLGVLGYQWQFIANFHTWHTPSMSS